jgi:hypothetical protein
MQEVLHLCELFFRFRLGNSFSFQFLLFVALKKKTKTTVVASVIMLDDLWRSFSKLV